MFILYCEHSSLFIAQMRCIHGIQWSRLCHKIISDNNCSKFKERNTVFSLQKEQHTSCDIHFLDLWPKLRGVNWSVKWWRRAIERHGSEALLHTGHCSSPFERPSLRSNASGFQAWNCTAVAYLSFDCSIICADPSMQSPVHVPILHQFLFHAADLWPFEHMGQR